MQSHIARAKKVSARVDFITPVNKIVGMSNQLKETVTALNTHFVEFNENIAKFLEKDNVSAAARARKSLLAIGKATREARKQVQERKKELKGTVVTPATP